jgi:hypothetical protein
MKTKFVNTFDNLHFSFAATFCRWGFWETWRQGIEKKWFVKLNIKINQTKFGKLRKRRKKMAELLRAIREYGPRIKLNKTASPKQLVKYVSDRTGLNRGEIQLMLGELHDAVLWFCRTGTPVKIEGLGSYTPVVKVGGRFAIGHRLDSSLKRALNVEKDFEGVILNSENKEKTVEELVELWNTDHPDDPVDLT